MTGTGKTSGYAPGSNKAGKRKKRSEIAPAVIDPAEIMVGIGFPGYRPGINHLVVTASQPATATLTDEERLQIQRRLRRGYLAEDATLGRDTAVSAMAPQANIVARVLALLPVRLIWRSSPERAQQH